MALHIANVSLPAGALVLAGFVAFGAAPALAADERAVLKMPPEMRADFLDHMSRHMDSLNNVIAAVAAGDFKHAAQIAREQLEPGAGKGFGHYLPIEFREKGLAMHRAASEFATAAEGVPVPPDPEGWKTVAASLGAISAQCQACHAAFRVE